MQRETEDDVTKHENTTCTSALNLSIEENMLGVGMQSSKGVQSTDKVPLLYSLDFGFRIAE